MDRLFPLKAVVVFAVIVLTAFVTARRHRPRPGFGPPNQITTLRALLVSLVAAAIGEPGAVVGAPATPLTWLIVVCASVGASLDGLDGWLARRFGRSTAFGARYDMEVDALLVLVLSVLAWQFDKAGAWIVTAGLLRYLFVAGGWVLPWLGEPLPPSRRRQTACVVQIVGLIVVIAPVLAPPWTTAIAAATLVVLTASFAADVAWLWRRRITRPRADGRASASWS
jgi:phosphatidylglycerophosphate synthase